MEIKEIIRRMKDHFRCHKDRLPTPYLDEAESEMYKALEELQELRDLEQQGRLLKLPCKIGETVWNTTWWDRVQESVTVDGKQYYRDVYKYKVSKSVFGYLDIDKFGTEVFLTKKEAEEACKKKNEENGV